MSHILFFLIGPLFHFHVVIYKSTYKLTCGGYSYILGIGYKILLLPNPVLLSTLIFWLFSFSTLLWCCVPLIMCHGWVLLQWFPSFLNIAVFWGTIGMGWGGGWVIYYLHWWFNNWYVVIGPDYFHLLLKYWPPLLHN